MFYQIYIDKDKLDSSDNGNFEDNFYVITNTQTLSEKETYYFQSSYGRLYVKGINGDYILLPQESETNENGTIYTYVFYNPVKEGIIYTENTFNINSQLEIDLIYKIKNLISNQTISKIEVEFAQIKVETNRHPLSRNVIFVNSNKIHGCFKNKPGIMLTEGVQGQELDIYTFETLQDISAKIRFLGVLPPIDLQDDEFIILNYYTED